MEKHLLVTVSEQKAALCGVRFVAKFFDRKDDMRITLFYTMPRPSRVWEEEKNYEALQETDRQETQIEFSGRQALEQAKQEFILLGFEPERVKTKLAKRKQSKALDIINEGNDGLYDAVVLGRRGLSLLEEVVDESTTKDVFTVEAGFPFYICRKPDYDRTGVLLCIDGSESSQRMIDHVGFMLAREERHTVTLFNVRRDADENPEKHFVQARSILDRNGLPVDRIREKVAQNKNPAAAILSENNENKYAVVATGSTGVGQGFKSRLFMGSVSMKLLKELYGSVLWAIR